jgi:hypothetical protein
MLARIAWLDADARSTLPIAQPALPIAQPDGRNEETNGL